MWVNCALIVFASVLSLAHAGIQFTALEIDNHPCKPENLKHTNRYICDNEGNVICQAGWRNPAEHDPLNDLNPCLEPICDADGIGCLHGECRAPNYCACEVGWEGANCEICVPLPGCVHGSCQNAFECNCESGWEGAYCDIASCDSCTNGECVGPNHCVCFEGWSGANCSDCQAMPGCLHGFCDSHPNTCKCESGWQGHLCDQPICSPSCVHGICKHNDETNENFCICEKGWQGADCSQCVPYWDCPNQDSNACVNPFECLCYGSNVQDPNNLCNNTLLSGQISSNVFG